MKHLLWITFTFYVPLANVFYSPPLFVLGLPTGDSSYLAANRLLSALFLLIQRCCTQPAELFSRQSLFAARTLDFHTLITMFSAWTMATLFQLV